MIKKIFLLTGILSLSINAQAQSAFKEIKAGHVYTVSIPEYMNRTVGLNSAASLQFKSVVKDVYGFIIEDFKEELKLVELQYSSASEFYEDFVKDFLKGEKNRKVMTPSTRSIAGVKFVESGATYYDKDAKGEIYYFIGIAETNSTFYKVLIWTSAAAKDQFIPDFQKLLYSIRD